MRRRVLTIVAAAWATGYLGLYLWVIDSQEGQPAGWYVGLLVVAVVLLLVALAARAAVVAARAALVAAAIVLGLCMLVGLMSVGLALLPACAAAIGAVALPRRDAVSQAPVIQG
jgi:ABC-type transport system involved in cytochrome c biogenesis permease subunit